MSIFRVVNVFFRKIFIKKNRFYSVSDVEVFQGLNKNSLVIDCGASIGEVAEKMAETGATVYAFEPNPVAYKFLHQRADNYSNLHCLNQGVSAKAGSIPFYLHNNIKDDALEKEIAAANGSSFLANKSNVNTGQPIQVEVIDLAKFITELGQPVDLVKIDIEGLEVEVLNHLLDTGVINQIKALYVETHEDKMPDLVKPTRELKRRIKKLKLRNIHLNWI